VRSTTPEYKGFRISFASGTIAPSYSCAGGGSIPFSRGCFKAKFAVKAGSDFQTVRVPFSAFSDMWSPATGDHTKECATDSDVCATAEKLKGIKRMEVWAEGALGKVHLEIQSIQAENAQGEVVEMEGDAGTCPGSKAFIHAKTQLSVKFVESCDVVLREMQRRVAGQATGKWVDPHNKGTYTITAAAANQLMLSRATGTGGGGGTGYDDKMIFTLSASGTGCQVEACSESQVMSVLDFSTNYCNVHDLYCADEGCNVGQQGTKLHYQENIETCSSHQHNQADCYKVSLPGEVQPLATEPSTTTLATFDGSSTSFEWSDQNDPVMGGKSTSSFHVEAGAGVFNGTCAIVPSLKAPGFCKISSQSSEMLQDASAHINGSLQLRVRSSTPDYKGFKVAFAAKGIPRTGFIPGSFKAGFELKNTAEWQLVSVPFDTFSSDWSAFTGRCDTKDPSSFGREGKQHHCCTAEHPEVCPTADFLSKITDVQVWAEGVVGDFHLEIQAIQASN